jgi:hypothetical protein
MAKFKCSICSGQLELSSHTIKVEDDKVVSPEAVCCNTYMESIRENKGLGTVLSRPGGRARGKNDPMRN